MDLSTLTNLYWHLRAKRFSTPVRRYYRYIAAEKKRLIDELGADPEYIRLYCRYLSKPSCKHALKRLNNYKNC